MRRIIAVAVALASIVLAGPSARGLSGGIGADLVVGGLAFPAGFTFAPDGRIFYGARFTGEIRIYDPGTGSDILFFDIPGVATAGEQGLLGLALHPRYPTRPMVFAYVTRIVGGSDRNQIIRLRDAGGTGTQPRAIWTEDVAASSNHNGGHIVFGPDGRLFANVGDAGNSANSQDLDVDAGKILRMNARGRPSPDNPFPDSLVWAFGHRNSYGFTFDPVTGLMWEDENGPECNDEINLVRSGDNLALGAERDVQRPASAPEEHEPGRAQPSASAGVVHSHHRPGRDGFL
jgi:glucose/arabinose dehydrogenase